MMWDKSPLCTNGNIQSVRNYLQNEYYADRKYLFNNFDFINGMETTCLIFKSQIEQLNALSQSQDQTLADYELHSEIRSLIELLNAFLSRTEGITNNNETPPISVNERPGPYKSIRATQTSTGSVFSCCLTPNRNENPDHQILEQPTSLDDTKQGSTSQDLRIPIKRKRPKHSKSCCSCGKSKQASKFSQTGEHNEKSDNSGCCCCCSSKSGKKNKSSKDADDSLTVYDVQTQTDPSSDITQNNLLTKRESVDRSSIKNTDSKRPSSVRTSFKNTGAYSKRPSSVRTSFNDTGPYNNDGSQCPTQCVRRRRTKHSTSCCSCGKSKIVNRSSQTGEPVKKEKSGCCCCCPSKCCKKKESSETDDNWVVLCDVHTQTGCESMIATLRDGVQQFKDRLSTVNLIKDCPGNNDTIIATETPTSSTLSATPYAVSLHSLPSEEHRSCVEPSAQRNSPMDENIKLLLHLLEEIEKSLKTIKQLHSTLLAQSGLTNAEKCDNSNVQDCKCKFTDIQNKDVNVNITVTMQRDNDDKNLLNMNMDPTKQGGRRISSFFQRQTDNAIPTSESIQEETMTSVIDGQQIIQSMVAIERASPRGSQSIYKQARIPVTIQEEDDNVSTKSESRSRKSSKSSISSADSPRSSKFRKKLGLFKQKKRRSRSKTDLKRTKRDIRSSGKDQYPSNDKKSTTYNQDWPNVNQSGSSNIYEQNDNNKSNCGQIPKSSSRSIIKRKKKEKGESSPSGSGSNFDKKKKNFAKKTKSKNKVYGSDSRSDDTSPCNKKSNPSSKKKKFFFKNKSGKKSPESRDSSPCSDCQLESFRCPSCQHRCVYCKRCFEMNEALYNCLKKVREDKDDLVQSNKRDNSKVQVRDEKNFWAEMMFQYIPNFLSTMGKCSKSDLLNLNDREKVKVECVQSPRNDSIPSSKPSSPKSSPKCKAVKPKYKWILTRADHYEDGTVQLHLISDTDIPRNSYLTASKLTAKQS